MLRSIQVQIHYIRTMRIIIPLSLRWHLLMVQIRNLIKYVICFRSTVPLRREILLFLHFWRSIAKSLFPQTQFRSYPQFKQRIKKTVWNYGNNFSHTSGRLFHLLSTKTFNDTKKAAILSFLRAQQLLVYLFSLLFTSGCHCCIDLLYKQICINSMNHSCFLKRLHLR